MLAFVPPFSGCVFCFESGLSWGWSGESIGFAVFLRYGNGLHMKPQITTVQNTTFSTEMLSLSKNASFFVQHFGKEHMSIYNDFDACNEFCIVLLYILPYVCIYIYTLFDKFIVFFTIVYASRQICI